MKTSIRIIAIFIVLSFITSDCILAQGGGGTTGNTTRRAPESVPPTPQTGTERIIPRATNSYTGMTEAEALRLEDAKIQDQYRQTLGLLAGRYNASTGRQIGAGSDNILVIPTGEIGVEELLTINEDMQVMTQIFRNELGSEAIPALGSLPLIGGLFEPTQSYRLLTNRNNTISSMYLQGYGALFMMNVDFPLSGPPETQEQQEETEKEDVDEVWEQTRQQIYEPRRVPVTVPTRRATERPEVVYDAEQVENLKTTLIQSLKHAANIRALAPDESVIIRITGSGRSGGIISVETQEKQIIVSRIDENGRNRAMIMTPEAYQDFIKPFSAPEVLVIRAKKSDIDAFAEGELDFGKFREKVQLLSYPLLGGTANATLVPRATTVRTKPATTLAE